MYGESWYEWGQLACPNCGQVYPYEQLGELDFFPEHPIFPTLRQPTPNQSCPRCGLAIDGDTKRIACHLATGEPDVGPLPPADEQAVRALLDQLEGRVPGPRPPKVAAAKCLQMMMYVADPSLEEMDLPLWRLVVDTIASLSE
jgi:hypothetical protein